MKKKMLYNLLPIIGMLLLTQSSQAQTWDNFGTGIDGSPINTGLGTQRWPTDTCRAKIDTITDDGMGHTVLKLSFAGAVDPYSSRWDPTQRAGYQTKALIVDFSMAPGLRNYELAKIKSVSPTTPFVHSITLDRMFTNIPNTNNAQLTEIILIPEYTNVYLTNPTDPAKALSITCAPWDSTVGHGGVCVFYCDDSLYQSGPNGNINTDYCGWPAYWNGGGVGAAPAPSIVGTTGAGGSSIGGNAGNASLTPWPYYTYLYIINLDHGDYVTGNCGGSQHGGNGGYGAIANPGYGPNAGHAGTSYPPADWTTKYMGMGNSGAGGLGGQGAGAGGYGGGGGASAANGVPGAITGSGAPTIGDAYGGQGGMGARGGGFVYIHAAKINIDTTNHHIFTSNGDGYPHNSNMAGNPASPLDSAGKGGDGGDGANMYISGSNVYPAGGGGVEGCQGNGADGGQGGKGGNAGFVWVVYNATNDATLKNIETKGGPGAPGGQGSYMGRKGKHGKHGTELSLCPPDFDTSLCHPIFGTYTDGARDTFCDCFDAFRILSMMNAHATSGSVTNYTNTSDTDIKAQKNSYLLFAESQHVITAASCSQQGYVVDSLFKCPLSCNSNSFFTNIATPTGTVDTSANPKWVGWGSAPHYYKGYFTKDTVTIGSIIVWSSSLYTSSNKDTLICSSNCDFSNPGADDDSLTDPRNGLSTPGDSGNNTNGVIQQEPAVQTIFPTQPYAPVVQKHSNFDIADSLNKITNLQLAGGTTSSVYASFNADANGPYIITVTDMLGRQWYAKTLNLPLGHNSIDIGIGGWKPGSYILTLLHDGVSDSKVFVIAGD